MNKLIEFLHDPEAKGLMLGNNGFRAERPTSAFVGIWYEGKVICKIEPDFIQHADTPDWYEEWEMPIHIPDESGIDVLQVVDSVVDSLKALVFDEVVYPLEAV